MKMRSVGCLGFLFGASLHCAFGIAGIDQPPVPSVPHEIAFESPKEISLTNGLRVIVAARPSLPLLAARVVIRNGGEADPADLAGVGRMTGSLLSKGTDKMTAPQIASAIESLGGEIDSGAQWDSSNAEIIVMSNNAEAALAILADVVQHPTFQPEELERLRAQTLDSLRVELQRPGTLAQLVTERVVFGSAPYGHALSGTIETVQKMRRDDLLNFYRAHYRPSNAALVLVGNITLEQGRSLAEKFFGEWKDAEQASQEKLADTTLQNWHAQNVAIDMPEAGQAAVTVAKPMIKRDSPDYYAGLVANAALGTGFVSRLNREIRIKRGLSYGAHSLLEARRDVGLFVASAQTKNQSAAEVATLLKSEMKRLASDPVRDEELKSREALLTGAFARRLETNQGVAGQISALTTLGLPLEKMNGFIPAIDAVTSEDVSAFAAKYFAAEPSLIVVGKAAEFIEPLRKDSPGLKVIPQGDLDLNRAELTKMK